LPGPINRFFFLFALAMTERYTRVQKLGTDTYGRAFRGFDNETKSDVVVKLIRNDQEDEEGLPASAVREISILKRLHHVSIVSLLDVCVSSSSLLMVLEFVKHNLRAHLHPGQKPFGPELIRSYAFQLLSCVTYLHDHGVVHCDIRPENILLERTGLLKLCAFDHALLGYTPCTRLDSAFRLLWYQPPEMVIGLDVIPEKVDVWSVACVIAEMAQQKVLFPGDSPIDEFFEICSVIGTPTAEDEWRELSAAAAERKWAIKETASTFVARWDGAEPEFVDLLVKMLKWNPSKRPNARDLLAHPYFDQVSKRLRELCAVDED
jgi:serine/threonine protein kinase